MASDPVVMTAMFRHCPSEDGAAIPASIQEEVPWAPGDHVLVRPIVGYYAALYRGRTSWGFIHYEAPDIQWNYTHLARVSTGRVGHVTCRECGASCIYPVWGKDGKMPCPSCGRKGGLDVTLVKEGGPEYFSLMGAEIQRELEAALAECDPRTAEEFRFPKVLLIARLRASACVLPTVQGAASARGLSATLLSEITVEELTSNEAGGPDTGLAIEPGATVGVLEADAAREGFSVTEGCVTTFVKLPFLPKLPPPVHRFGGIRL